ncbi:transcriptional regulator ATRX homolog [Vigna unguiculata]|uniref:U5 small nuclear ribonucleoprotein TSSC4 n=1 Tax=Vigna unguiculata TaxID=3917 RepID=A0A4D6M6B8_VIGUN|nr:transcriptional regulator ATRX homolog [Vigna unguiculata]QCD96929.1 tumor suppressing sub-chromosomal transferable candidate 4 [Vigna unguiculata]
MEDSFRVRVEKAFGSLPIPSSSINSLWSLTEDEIDNKRSKRTHQPQPQPYPFSSSRVQLEDLDDLEDDDDEEEAPRGPSKPPDYNDEQWQIRSGIGQDCTLDYEEEEDQYDKQAIGKEDSDDRVYMKDVKDDGVEISSSSVFPTSFRDFVRDPRANHLAARIRLKQDDEAARKIDALHVSEKSTPDIGGGGDATNPKSILKSKDNSGESRPQKRVRFDPECDDKDNYDDDGHEETRDVRMKTSSMEEVPASDQLSKSQEFNSAVPDYIRNPSRYTRYTFDDSPSEMDDKSNKEAYMSFLSQLNKGTASQADDVLDDLPSVTFISKKKSGDARMRDSEMVSKNKLDAGVEAVNRKSFPVGIAAGDSENSDVSAMEEDEQEVGDAKKSMQKFNRKYRKKTQEELEEPIV